MGLKYGYLFPGMLDALKASPTHRLSAIFEWEDHGLFGQQRKRYELTITLLSDQEARQRFSLKTPYPENLVIGFAGNLPPSKASIFRFHSSMGGQPGYTVVFPYGEGFFQTLDELDAGSGSDWESR